jgi:hypothetical protein
VIFLMEYDRPSGRIVGLDTSPDAERVLAEDKRLEREVQLQRTGLDREVVLLEAVDERALRRTHRRYFENASQIGGVG